METTRRDLVVPLLCHGRVRPPLAAWRRRRGLAAELPPRLPHGLPVPWAWESEGVRGWRWSPGVVPRSSADSGRCQPNQPASGPQTGIVQIYLNNFAGEEKINGMPRALKLTKDMPTPISQALLGVGANLRLARERRGLSIRALAAEINVSVPTVLSMERGEPTVSIGVYAAALLFYGRLEWLPDLMAPEFDREAEGRDNLLPGHPPRG